jgi:hypothetical protein
MNKGITGDEPIDLHAPEGALSEYYRAFNSHDLNLMRQNWDASDEVTMYYPLGGIRRGWEEIGELYEQIFSGPAGVMVEFQDFAIQRFPDVCLVSGVERGVLRTLDRVLDFRIRTSRLFAWRGGRWRQMHHHGSIEEPELLALYLSLVLTGQVAAE